MESRRCCHDRAPKDALPATITVAGIVLRRKKWWKDGWIWKRGLVEVSIWNIGRDWGGAIWLAGDEWFSFHGSKRSTVAELARRLRAIKKALEGVK